MANGALASLLVMKNNPAESVRYFQAAIALQPAHPGRHRDLGKALGDLGRWDEALVELKEAARLVPDSAPYSTSIGLALNNLKRPAEAERRLRQVLKTHPGYPPCLTGLAHSLFQQGRHEEAFDTYQRAIAVDPNFAYAHRQLKEHYLILRRWEEAQEAWQQWLASNPPLMHVWGDYAEIRLDSNPNEHTAWDGYAELCLYLGNEAEYRRARTELLTRFAKTTDPRVAERTGRACVILPASEEELLLATSLIDRAMASQREKPDGRCRRKLERGSGVVRLGPEEGGGSRSLDVPPVAARGRNGTGVEAIACRISPLPRRGERGEDAFRAELPDGSVRFDTPQFDDVRIGPEVQWLWPGRILRGMVTLIEGAEGAGKSFVVLDIAARVSRGLGWPGLPEFNGSGDASRGDASCGDASCGDASCGDASCEIKNDGAGEVLILCRPDDCRSAARRLAALGADFERILPLKDFGTFEPGEGRRAQRPPSFPSDLPAIETELRRGALSLVVIDSLADFCPLPQQVAETLRRLNELAEKYDTAIVVTLPACSRCDGQGVLKVTSRYRSGGARCVWTILADPDVPARRVFVARRTNFCEGPAGLEFRLEGGRIVWNAAVRIDPADPLGLQAGVSLCLAEALRDGFRSATEVLREGQQCGFTPKQMRSAAKRLGIESRKSSGFGADGGWTWWTPEQWAERVGRLQALGAKSAFAKSELFPDHDGSPGHDGTPGHSATGHSATGHSGTGHSGMSACQTQLETPADRSSSRLVVGPVWINSDGTVSEAVCVRGDEILPQVEGRDGACDGATTPAVSQVASSKNEESLEKQGDFQRPASGPLPRDGYSRRQERKRRQRERENARRREAGS